MNLVPLTFPMSWLWSRLNFRWEGAPVSPAFATIRAGFARAPEASARSNSPPPFMSRLSCFGLADFHSSTVLKGFVWVCVKCSSVAPSFTAPHQYPPRPPRTRTLLLLFLLCSSSSSSSSCLLSFPSSSSSSSGRGDHLRHRAQLFS